MLIQKRREHKHQKPDFKHIHVREYIMREIAIKENEAGQRFDKFLKISVRGDRWVFI